MADLEDFREGIIDYTDAVDEIADGSRELRDGVQELQDEANDMIDEYFTFDIDNLTQFLVAGDNPRIDAASGDVIINKYAGMVSGIILMVMFTYVISVFVVHNIEKESSVIGALYALGVTRGQLLFHYLLNPMMILRRCGRLCPGLFEVWYRLADAGQYRVFFPATHGNRDSGLSAGLQSGHAAGDGRIGKLSGDQQEAEAHGTVSASK